MLLSPNILDEEASKLKDFLLSVIETYEGEVKHYDKWGKYLLAYKVKKHTYGIYVFFYFGIKSNKAKDVIAKIESDFKLKYSDQVLRYVFVKKGKTAAEDYCKPDSLEAAPRREKSYDIDTVLTRKSKHTRSRTNTFTAATETSENASAKEEASTIEARAGSNVTQKETSIVE
jgi:ribosomal protein S6